MKRKISLNELRTAVDEAFEMASVITGGNVDNRNVDADADAFGLSVVLTDGTLMCRGDVGVRAPIGSIAKIVLSSLLLENMPLSFEHGGSCCCSGKAHHLPGLTVSAQGVKNFAALEPKGDADSKWRFFEQRLVDLSGGAPVLNRDVYRYLCNDAADNRAVELLKTSDLSFADDIATSVDLYLRACAMSATVPELAMLGATIAADGVQPLSGNIVYDGTLSQHLVGLIAAKGVHKMNVPWLTAVGLPAKSSFGGAIVGIYPGVMAVAAISARLNKVGVSERGHRAIAALMQRLDINLFSSLHTEIIRG